MLNIENVSYAYTGNKFVLKEIDASFEKGKMYCIQGKSGSGKTTFLSLISGLDRVNHGDIFIDSESLKTLNLDDYRSKKIGVVFQAYNLLLQLSALENILLSLYISKVKTSNPKTFALNLLDQMGISEEKATRKAIELSGGEQQRVAIARAISHSPDYIFADEPTGNLDFETEKKIMGIFQTLVAAGKCVIIVTHSNRVVKYADHVCRMKSGKLTMEEMA